MLVVVLLLSTINITEVVICKKKNHIVKLMGNIHVSPVTVSVSVHTVLTWYENACVMMVWNELIYLYVDMPT